MAVQKDHAVRYWVGELLTQDGWRKAAKITSMPMVYGSTFLSNFQPRGSRPRWDGGHLMAESEELIRQWPSKNMLAQS